MRSSCHAHSMIQVSGAYRKIGLGILFPLAPATAEKTKSRDAHSCVCVCVYVCSVCACVRVRAGPRQSVDGSLRVYVGVVWLSGGRRWYAPQWWWWYGGSRATFVTARRRVRLVCSAPADGTECDSIAARAAGPGFTSCFLCDRMSVVFVHYNIVPYMSYCCSLGANWYFCK